MYKSTGYKTIVVSNKGFKNNEIDPLIFEWLKKDHIKELSFLL